MTNLEFIEEQIKKEQSMIKTYEEYFKTDKTEFDKQITRGYIQIHQKNISMLQQIKIILGAWEVVKRYTITPEDVVEGGYYFIKGLDDEYETLKKALELKNV